MAGQNLEKEEENPQKTICLPFKRIDIIICIHICYIPTFSVKRQTIMTSSFLMQNHFNLSLNDLQMTNLNKRFK